MEVFGSRRRDNKRTHLACGSLFGEIVEELIAGYAFATSDLGHALSETLVQRGFVVDEPVFFGVEKVESVCDDLRRLAEVASVEFTLDTLFGLSVEGEIHGASISRGDGLAGVAGGREAGQSSRLRLHSGLRQRGSPVIAVGLR